MYKSAKHRNLQLFYPSYNNIKDVKKKCFPQEDAFKITDSLAEVKLQPLLDHTVTRLVEAQDEVLKSFQQSRNRESSLQMLYKWGCDGCGSHSRYKQAFDGQDECENFRNDSEILVTSIVPLQLCWKNDLNEEKIILWQNPRTSSTRYCRPIRIQYLKETPEIIKEEFLYIEQQISMLQPTKILIQNNEILISHILMKTMVDGKVCNSISSNKIPKFVTYVMQDQRR